MTAICYPPPETPSCCPFCGDPLDEMDCCPWHGDVAEAVRDARDDRRLEARIERGDDL
jgi:hypothetical protein